MSDNHKDWIDIPDIAKKLQPRAENILKQWFPKGTVYKDEFLIGDLSGKGGQSLRINIGTGLWRDWGNPEDKGGDLVSLYAAKEKISNLDAARALAENYNLKSKTELVLKKSLNGNGHGNGHDHSVVSLHNPFFKSGFGDPTEKYQYYKEGRPYFLQCRYERQQDGKKQKSFRQLVQREDGVWLIGLKAAGIQAPYPLFSDKIETDTVLIVEGEKKCIAARKICPHNVVSCFGGVAGILNADWSPVYGKNIIIWPDNDKAGWKASSDLKEILKEHCPSIKIVDASRFKPKYDAYDFVKEKKNWNEIIFQKHGEMSLSVNGRGEPYMSEHNVEVLLGNKYNGRLWFDEFRRKRMMDERALTDADYLSVLVDFQGNYGMHTINKSTVCFGTQSYCEKNRRNPVLEYYDSLDKKWDGTARIKNYMHDIYGTPKTSYANEVSKNFFLAMVARILNPGCKFDHMIILEGKQGIKKSMSLKELAGEEFYWDCSETMDSRDFIRGLKGKIIVELSELNSILKSDTDMVKKVLSCSTDEYVEKYMTENVVIPRTCVFVGTTNEKEYLKDATGNRRFWPIEVKKEADLDLIKQNREQLFAEAVFRYKNGETYWEFKEEESKKEVIEHQENRMITDEWIEEVSKILSQNIETTIPYVLEKLGIPLERMGVKEKHRVGRCLKMLGYDNVVTRGDDGKLKRVWARG